MKLDLSVIFNKAIRKIRTDIVGGVADSNQFGKHFEDNADSTAKQKGFNKRLVGKRKTFVTARNYKSTKATAQKQEATLSVPNPKIALYNQMGTSRGIPATPFFGISEKAQDDVLKETGVYINKWVSKEIKGMGFKKV